MHTNKKENGYDFGKNLLTPLHQQTNRARNRIAFEFEL
jgi:hypothetical protein